MRRFGFSKAPIAVLAALVACSAYADTVALRGGDVLSGRLLSICDGAVLFQTSLSGQMMAPVDEVVSLTTDGYVNVSIDGAASVPARFSQGKEGFRLACQDGTSRIVADLSAVTAATPLPESKTRVDWETGVLWRTGREDYVDLFGRLGILRETDAFGLWSQWFIERADTENFPRRFLSLTEWRLGLRDKLSPMFALEFERDTDAGLALRGGLSLNVGKRLLDSDVQSLDAAIGLGGSVARYDADLAYSDTDLLDTRLRYPDEKTTERLQLRLRARYAHAILGNGSFEEAITLYPNLTDAGEFRARSESSVLFPITPRLHVKLDLLVDFDSDPEFERLDEWRTSVGASLLWRF